MGILTALFNIFMAMAIITLIVFTIAMYIRINQVDREIQQDAGTLTAVKVAAEKKIEQLDAAIQEETKQRMTDIDDIIVNMNAIVASIDRMDASIAQDHRDLVDIRRRYINFREPVQEGTEDGTDHLV